MRILIVEDDFETGSLIKKRFEKEGFVVDWEKDGKDASYRARTNDYDLIVLDRNLPGQDGTAVISEIRHSGRKVPIIMLTVISALPDKVAALGSGADDYMTKPFAFEELLARVRALLRRPSVLVEDVINFGSLVIDVGKQTVSCNGKVARLTRKEFQLLEYLARNRGRVVSRGEIMEHVWEADADPFSNTIETHILNLRRKIDKGRGSKLIHTFSGRGYKLDISP
jgi:two-component system OmpR family response regulator